MTEATITKNKMQITVEEGGSSALTLRNDKVEVSADGKEVTLYTNGSFSFMNDPTKPAASAVAAAISKDNAVILNGVAIKLSADGCLAIVASGSTLISKRPPANDTAAIAAVALVLGQQTADGVYAGLTADGKQQIYAMPKDLSVTLTFNNAAKAVKKLNDQNALGHNDWQIPSRENLHILQKNQNEGSLKGTFKTASSSGSVSPDWYWSSTEYRGNPSHVWNVRLSGGSGDWDLKDNVRLSCRPVRLVAVASA